MNKIKQFLKAIYLLFFVSPKSRKGFETRIKMIDHGFFKGLWESAGEE